MHWVTIKSDDESPKSNVICQTIIHHPSLYMYFNFSPTFSDWVKLIFNRMQVNIDVT